MDARPAESGPIFFCSQVEGELRNFFAHFFLDQQENTLRLVTRRESARAMRNRN